MIFLEWLQSLFGVPTREDIALMFEEKQRQRDEFWEAYHNVFKK